MNNPAKPLDSAAALVADTYLGNLHEKPALAKDSSQIITVEISRQDCQKGRIFVQTKTGQSIGIVKGRDWLLKDGDVLSTQSQQLVVVRLQQQKVIALRFDSSAHNHAVHLVHLGHVLGNHHWPIVIKGDVLYVELVADAELVESTITELASTLGIQGLSISTDVRSAEQFVDFGRSKHVHQHAH